MSKKKEDSDLIMRIRRSRRKYAFFYLMTFILISSILSLFFLGYPVNKIAVICTAIFILIGIKIIEIARYRDYFEITNNYVIYSNGIFFTDKKRVLLKTLSDVVLLESPWQRFFKYGTIQLYRYGTQPVIILDDIPNPRKISRIIKERLDSYQQ